VLVEAYHLIRKLERYYTIIQKAYNCITTKILRLNREMALQMSFKATNDSVSLNRLVLTLLVYSAYPQITEYNPPSFIITQQA
jgi:hypothetical protein